MATKIKVTLPKPLNLLFLFWNNNWVMSHQVWLTQHNKSTGALTLKAATSSSFCCRWFVTARFHTVHAYWVCLMLNRSIHHKRHQLLGSWWLHFSWVAQSCFKRPGMLSTGGNWEQRGRRLCRCLRTVPGPHSWSEATTRSPEHWGGTRYGDYRFVWIYWTEVGRGRG